MYYQLTIDRIRKAVELRRPGTVPAFKELKDHEQPSLAYLLWMCGEVEKMNINSWDEALKAGRWMGWVFAHIEFLGIWTNKDTREAVREDHRLHLDKPH